MQVAYAEAGCFALRRIYKKERADRFGTTKGA